MTPSGRHARANALLLVAALFWGMAFPAQRVAAANMGAFSYTSIRFAMGALLLAGVIAVLDRRRGLLPAQKRAATRAVVLPGVGVGLLLTLAVNLQQVGLVTTTASNAAFITGLYLIWVPILGVFGGKRLRWPIAVAVVLAVAGLYLIAVTGRFTLRPGDALMLAAGLAFAVEILVIDRFAPRLDLIRFACAQFASCAAFSGAFALWRDAAPFGGIGHTLWPLAYGGFVSVGIAYTLQTIAQRDAEPAPASLIMSLEAVFGALGGWWFLHEHLGVRGWAGAALMMAGILVSHLGTASANSAENQPDSR